eukprot:556154_1
MTEVLVQAPMMPGLTASRSLGADIISQSEPLHLSGAAPTPSFIAQEKHRDDVDRDDVDTEDLNTTPDNTTVVGPKIQFSALASNPAFAFLNHQPRTKILPRAQSCPDIHYDDCREFDSFSGEWIDSKGQIVLISPWGVIRYPNNPKLRFEAIFMGPNHLSVTFDKDPRRRKFVGKLNHECSLLIWSNDTKWAKRGSKHDPRLQQPQKNIPKLRRNNSSCLVQ